MQASRELDILVATKVLDLPEPEVSPFNGEWIHHFHRETYPGSGVFKEDTDKQRPLLPYSTEFAAAWLVVAHLTKHYHWRISSPFDPPHGETLWFAGLTPHGCTGWNGRPDLECGGETGPEAICLVALKAVGAIPLEDRDVDSTLPALQADRA